MGYESRVYAIKRVDCNGYVIGCEIAQFEIFSCSYGNRLIDEWRDLFTVPIDYDLTEDGSRADCYGNYCKAASVGSVRNWLRDFFTKNDIEAYTRAWAFLCWLDGIHGRGYLDLQLVEYGH